MFLHRLWREEDANAIVEYALLISLVAMVNWPAINAIEGALRTAYLRWSNAGLALWQMPPCAVC